MVLKVDLVPAVQGYVHVATITMLVLHPKEWVVVGVAWRFGQRWSGGTGLKIGLRRGTSESGERGIPSSCV